MADLVVTSFMTLDGVVQAPGGPTEDPSDGFEHGGWLVPYADPVMGEIMDGIFQRADAFLLGRRTYEIFAGHWPNVTDQDPVAIQLHSLPKHVASRSLDTVDWARSSLVRDVSTEVPELKVRYEGELQVHGSGHLVQSLLKRNLVDELRLLVFPVVLGSGKRLFGDGARPTALELIESRSTSTGALYQVYKSAGVPTQGSFELA